MKVKLLQYSIKFEMLPDIHRYTNQIEDAMREWFGVPNVVALPANMQSVDAPRVISTSNSEKKSQIIFTQISASIIDEDCEWPHNEQFNRKVKRLNELLLEMGITKYYYAGLSVIIEKQKSAGEAAKTVCEMMHMNFSNDIYESAYATVKQKDDIYFLNEKISSQKNISNSENFLSPDLVNYSKPEEIKEYILVEIDINDRLYYAKNGTSRPISECEKNLNNVSRLLNDEIMKWG